MRTFVQQLLHSMRDVRADNTVQRLHSGHWHLSTVRQEQSQYDWRSVQNIGAAVVVADSRAVAAAVYHCKCNEILKQTLDAGNSNSNSNSSSRMSLTSLLT